jgi:hypothetical protein
VPARASSSRCRDTCRRSASAHALRGELSGFSALGVRYDETLVRGSVRPAADFRTELDVRPEQKLVLLLFCRDELLERLWGEPVLLEQIAVGKYDLVIGPSYSLYIGRRLHYVVNGPGVFRRLRYLYERIDEERLTLTEATLAAPPYGARSADGLAQAKGYETSFRHRCARYEQIRQAAAAAALGDRAV